LWCGIHETAHIIAARSYTKLSNVKFKLYPHKNKSLGFVWASVSWKPEKRLSDSEFAWVSIAPRFPDILAVILFPLWALMPNGTAMLIWGAIWGAGLIDLFVGSLGISKTSDLRRAAKGWECNPWILRINGMMLILVSAVTGVLLFLYAAPVNEAGNTHDIDAETIQHASSSTCDPSVHQFPNEGLTECKSSPVCPAGMAQVDNFCMDRFEASLINIETGSSWSPYHHPPKNIRIQAVSLLGAVPQGYIDGLSASRACTANNKRLCTSKEWLRACRGKNMHIYPYGNKRLPGTCNDARTIHPAIELFGRHKNVFQKIQNPCINQLLDSVSLTGGHPECVTGESIYDMMGNLHEWIADDTGTFRGGYYVDTYRNGPGCLYRTTAHSIHHWDYSTGFRCCKSL
tara:strand:- start:771 stop:1973 length:1203 start_codon:yes stop_codon:yes gene_type:complete